MNTKEALSIFGDMVAWAGEPGPGLHVRTAALAVLDDLAERLESTKKTKPGQRKVVRAAVGPPVEGSIPSPGPTDADERALFDLDRAAALAYLPNADDEEFSIEYNKCLVALAHLRSRLAAPRVSVSRSLVSSILAEAGGDIGIETERVERACVRLREAGVVIHERTEY